MRIGIITATYLPPQNGVATSTSLYIRGLRQRGHEVRVFAPRHPQQQAVDEKDIYRLNSSFTGARALGAPADYPMMLLPGPLLTSRLPLRDLDILHTMHPFLAGKLALSWSRLSRAPVVFTAHTQYEQYLHYAKIPQRIGRVLLRPHIAAFANRVDKVLAPGRAMIDMLRDYGVKKDIELFPNPVDLTMFSAVEGGAFRAEYGIPQDAPLVLYLGRLAPEKNLSILLQAFVKARALRPEIHLLMVGGGPSMNTIQEEARLRKIQNVAFTGSLAYTRVPEALTAADVFLTASTSEVLPMSMIEALASGTPLIAAQSPAAIDLIHPYNNGIIANATPKELSEALLYILQPAQLLHFQAAARKSAQTYSLETRAAALDEVYMQAIRYKKQTTNL